MRLLGRFDPLLLPHKDKSWLIDAAHKAHIWRPAGQIAACVLYHGRIVGAWRSEQRPAKRWLRVTVSLFDRALESRLRAPLTSEVQRLGAFWGCDDCELVFAASDTAADSSDSD